MNLNSIQETFQETIVTYTLEVNGSFIIIENVPARVCLETGEKLFSPETVEKIQKIIQERRTPTRVIQTPVYQFTS